jgi:hypothetical protein
VLPATLAILLGLMMLFLSRRRREDLVNVD